MSVLSAEDLTVAWDRGGGQDGATVLRDLTFSVERGRVLGLVGESGAGKSMIGRAIAGNLPDGFDVTGGALRFADQDLVSADAETRRTLLGNRIAFIPQEPLTALNPLMTIGAQFGEHLARLRVPRQKRRESSVDALRSVRLREPEVLLDRYSFQLSGGMCQRVLIAMAFASRPALVIADEPTTALDVSTQVHVVELIRALQADHGTALVFITHDLRLAARVCDEIVVLYAGEMVERGPARALMEAPRHPYTRSLKASNPPLTGPIRRLASLPDQMPGLAGLRDLLGCRFAPRCPVADPACAAARPELLDLGGGHWVRCSPGCLRVEPDSNLALLQPQAPAPRQGGPILTVENVSKYYPGRRNWYGGRSRGVEAVRGASFAVGGGEFVGIVGESGSGKSTLAQLIAGLETPTTGRIVIDDLDVTAGEARAREARLELLQMIFQDPQSALNPRRPIGRLVTQPMEAARRSATVTARRARALELLAETGLARDLVDRFPAQLSGGQKQRVNIARALCVTPRLLVADEIVSGLDVSVQAQILNLLLDLREELSIALILISHDLAVVRYLCSRVLVMRHGEVVETGPVEAVFQAPKHPYTRMLLDSIPPDDLDRPWPTQVGRPRVQAHAA
jgi:peptide/nickel transport system ATP-binding protein